MRKQKTSRKGEGSKKILLCFADLDRAEETAESGMFVDKEDVKLIYNALKAYTPSDNEKHLHEILLETYEEILVVDLREELTHVN